MLFIPDNNKINLHFYNLKNKLGGKLSIGLLDSHFDENFYKDICYRVLQSRGEKNNTSEIKILSTQRLPFESTQGIIANLNTSTGERILGFSRILINWQSNGVTYNDTFILKSKAAGLEIRKSREKFLEKFDKHCAEKLKMVSPFIIDKCHLREPMLYGEYYPRMHGSGPEVYKTWIDESQNIFMVVMEEFKNVKHLETLDNLDVWTEKDMSLILSAMAPFHASFADDLNEISGSSWLESFDQINNERFLEFRTELLKYCSTALPEIFTAQRSKLLERLFETFASRKEKIKSLPMTLIHGDLIPRNVCIKLNQGNETACIYDWELAQIHLPQRDLCEFICYVAKPELTKDLNSIKRILKPYQEAFDRHSMHKTDQTEFDLGFRLALEDFATSKLLVQGISHQQLKKKDYFIRLANNTFNALAFYD